MLGVKLRNMLAVCASLGESNIIIIFTISEYSVQLFEGSCCQGLTGERFFAGVGVMELFFAGAGFCRSRGLPGSGF